MCDTVCGWGWTIFFSSVNCLQNQISNICVCAYGHITRSTHASIKILCDAVKLVILHFKWMSTRSNIGPLAYSDFVPWTTDYTIQNAIRQIFHLHCIVSAPLAFNPMIVASEKGETNLFLFDGRWEHINVGDEVWIILSASSTCGSTLVFVGFSKQSNSSIGKSAWKNAIKSLHKSLSKKKICTHHESGTILRLCSDVKHSSIHKHLSILYSVHCNCNN